MSTDGGDRGDGGEALWKRHRARLDVPLLAVVAVIVWGVGLGLPLVATEQLIGSDRAYSVLSGLWELARSRYFYLAIPLALFSVVFPGAKLLLLLYTWLFPMDPGRRRRLLHWLDWLGKWSMLDVYVVLIMAGALQLGILAESVLREGIYVFGGGILLSMVAATLARGVVADGEGERELEPGLPEEPVLHVPVAAVLALGLFAAGVVLPLLHTEKWIFWENQYSLLGAASGMLGGGMTVLGIGFVLFVIVLPVVQQLLVLLLGVLQWSDVGAGGVRLLLEVERWAMMDVVALALVVVFIRLGNMTDAQFRVGAWMLGAAVLLTAYASARIRRLYGAT